MITQEYYLDLVPGSFPVVCHCSQFDDGNRTLVFKLHQSGIPYEIKSGDAIQITGTKPDRLGIAYTLTATPGATQVSFVVTEQTAAVAGTVKCKLEIRNGESVLGTSMFHIEVERAGIDAGTAISESDIPAIAGASIYAAQAAQEADRAEQFAANASASANEIKTGDYAKKSDIPAPVDISGKVDNTEAGFVNLIGNLLTSSTITSDEAYWIGQSSGSLDKYRRKPMTVLWDYIKSKGAATTTDLSNRVGFVFKSYGTGSSWSTIMSALASAGTNAVAHVGGWVNSAFARPDGSGNRLLTRIYRYTEGYTSAIHHSLDTNEMYIGTITDAGSSVSNWKKLATHPDSIFYNKNNCKIWKINDSCYSMTLHGCTVTYLNNAVWPDVSGTITLSNFTMYGTCTILEPNTNICHVGYLTKNTTEGFDCRYYYEGSTPQTPNGTWKIYGNVMIVKVS